jgi:hypothetical protein
MEHGMFRRVLAVFGAAGVLVAVALVALALSASAAPGAARAAEPGAGLLTATPVSAGSSAEWTVGELTFESRYPHGFVFTAEISSSAGPIVRGRVIWSLAPGTQRSAPFEIDPDTGQLVAEWQPGPGESTPPWLGLTYTWSVGDAAGNSLETEPRYAEYADTSRKWLRSESEDIIVFSQGLPAEVNDLTLEAMAEQRETYRAAWGDLLPYRPRAILFGDLDAWREWQVGQMSANVAGLTRSEWGGTVQRVTGEGVRDIAYGTVLHEIAHLYQDAFTFMVAGNWFTEGNATFFELQQYYDYEAAVRSLAAAGQLPALLEGTGPGVSGRDARRGYDIGYTFWVWLADNYGLEGHRQLITLIKEGVGRNEAIEQVTGLTVAEVESRWRVWLGASPTPPTLVPTPAFFFLPSPTPYVVGK